ncbi:MAG: hypothetical protein HRU33_22790 [Rhodobacteraceae bacterium]|nr:hypothetical protein [Paracoccaceae bacterium]
MEIEIIAARNVTKLKPTADQKVFQHGYQLGLERLAEQLFGKKYHKSVNRTDIKFWATFYRSAFEVLKASTFRSIGSIDRSHEHAIRQEIDRFLVSSKNLKSKDEIHGELIVRLFRLVFLLLGREPYPARGKLRDFNTFRTLNYSQTKEQRSWLIQGHIQRSAETLGFEDSFAADYAFLEWCRANKRSNSDRSSYTEWAQAQFPEIADYYR